jgi:glucodextranase-like protein/PASTA domain-containing protein
MRVPVLFAAVCLVAAGCGGDDGDRAQRALVPVELDVTAPDDMAVVQSETIEVRGSVEPAGANVKVLGRPADVSGGTFRAEVPLGPGANVIDVMASARGRAAAMTAFRVTRELPVEVPDLDGLEVPEVEERLSEVGLVPDITERGGLIDDLLPGEPAVCEQDPEPGTEVRRGTTVRVQVAPSC